MTDQVKTVVVWDIPVRIFHWSLVLFFAIAYLTGDESEQWHAYSGYVVSGLLVFRLIWGFIGTKYARFSSFVFSPQVIRQYLGSMLEEHPKRYLGHNPAGGAMVMALLLTLALCCWTGLVAYGKEGQGPLAQAGFATISAAHADSDDQGKRTQKMQEGEFWEDIHKFLSHMTLLLAAIHLFGVALSSLLHNENLVRAMINGRKESRDGDN